MLDVVIRGGSVVDGSGAPARRADIGVRGDRIVEIGTITADAETVIDATEKAVTPGFIDVHTHYDAQVFWDGALTPSCLHGVTTVLGGNCGFTIAPLSDDGADAEYLMRMLARVEGMPLESLQLGVPWSWRTTAEYFDAVEGNLAINAGFMVGHSTIRRVVMGTEATQREASPSEIERMRRLLRESLDAGAFGLSSSWARSHNDADGRMVPSRYATTEELLALSAVVGEFPGTSLEFIPSLGPFEPWAIDLLAAMWVAAQRALNWNVMRVSAANLETCRAKLQAGDVAASRGGKVVALTVPVGNTTRLSFRSGFGLDLLPGWEEVMFLPFDEKVKVFADPEGRAKLNALAQSAANPVPFVADWGSKAIFDVVAPENEQYRGRLVGEIAADQGRAPWDVLCDIALADELNTLFGPPPTPSTEDDWEARREIWTDPRTLIGGSDAGAHLDLLASFNYTTVMLNDAVRQQAVLSLEEAVHLLTEAPAALYGLTDRGRLVEGAYADIVVMDPTSVASDKVAVRFDLPGGAGRLYAGASGVDHVLVNGSRIVRDGATTGASPGTLLRAGRDSHTPSW